MTRPDSSTTRATAMTTRPYTSRAGRAAPKNRDVGAWLSFRGANFGPVLSRTVHLARRRPSFASRLMELIAAHRNTRLEPVAVQKTRPP